MFVPKGHVMNSMNVISHFDNKQIRKRQRKEDIMRQLFPNYAKDSSDDFNFEDSFQRTWKIKAHGIFNSNVEEKFANKIYERERHKSENSSQNKSKKFKPNDFIKNLK